MSKVLRRPLFRGGPVDPRGTGITSGLDDGRVRKQTGGGFFQKYILGPKFGGVMTPQQELMQNLYTMPPGASDVDRMKAMAELISEQQIGEPLQGDGFVPSYLTATPLYKTAYGDDPEEVKGQLAKVPLGDSYEPKKQNNIDDIDDIEGVADEGKALGPVNTGGLNTFENLGIMGKEYAKVRANNEKVYDRIKARQEAREKGNMIKPPNETEISQEDIIDSIFKERVAKAKRGDIADVLGGAAEGFLTGGLREGLVGATRASRGPGRAEQLENTLASLKVQDKLGQAKEARTQKFELEKLEKALKGQEKIAALKGPALSDYGKKRNELTAQGFDSNTADRIARGGYANLDELMIAKPDLPLRQFETAVRYIYGENSVKGKLTEEELKDQTLLNNLDPGIYIVDKQRTIVDTRSGKVNTIRY